MAKINENTQYYHGYKFLIYPTDEQKKFIDECIDVARYVYNWAIEQEEKQYQLYLDGKVEKKKMFIGFFDLCHMFSIHRNETEWLQKYPLGFCREALNNAVIAFLNWFNKICHKPVFKSKKTSRLSYHPRADRMHIRQGNMLLIEGLHRNPIQIDELVLDHDFYDAHFSCQTISKDNLGNYYVSFNIVKDKPLTYFEDNNIPESKPLGIDLNFRKDSRVVCSDGTRFTAPKITKYEKKIKRLSRKHTKDVNRQKELERANPDKIIEPSKRSEKRKNELRKYYRKIQNVNITFASVVAKRIVEKRPKVVIMEKLPILDDIMKRPWFAKYIQFNPLGLIKDKIKRKCEIYNIQFVFAPREYPSSQICSNCGNKKKINSSKLTYICPVCGMRMDRDLNAALNLERLAYTVDFTNMSNINLATI